MLGSDLEPDPYLGESFAHDKKYARFMYFKCFTYRTYCSLTSNQLNINVNDKDSHETVEQVTKFIDGNPSWVYELPYTPDSTMSTLNTANESMQDFFSRPIRIATLNWTVGSSVFTKIDPWTLFWENKRNVNKIATYNLLRCRMHLTFRINGNAFLYGRIIASYIPFQATNDYDDMTVDRAFFIQDVVEASQRPHVYLDPTTNSGGEMVLPYFYWKNYMEVTRADWRDMGGIIFHTINVLKHANGAADTITIQVYAHASDVEFGMPTSSQQLGLVPQSSPEYEPQAGKKGAKKDEYEKSAGVVSGPLSTFAQIAGMLQTAPVIGPYAKATQIAASSASNVAKIFGYSRPVQVEGTAFVKPEYSGNMANHNVVDNSIKLAADIKQETTIDSRIAGLDGTDEMTIKSLAMRESYLTTFSWLISDTVNESLFTMNCCPDLYNILTSTPREYHFTPSCFVSQLFKYWHGTMNVRLQFVCSKYHKGRVKVVYDPRSLTNMITSNEDNTNYSQVIDLAETRDITIKIPWGQPRHWMHTTDVSKVGPALQYSVLGNSVTTPGFPGFQATNGQLGVYVINELTTPNSIANNDIDVNVFTSMCDDFCVMDPTGSKISNLTFFPQSQPEYDSDVEDEQIDPIFVQICCILHKLRHSCRPYERQASPEDEMDGLAGCSGDNAPVSTEDCTMPLDNSKDIHPSFFDIYPGESIVSLRSMLKRYCFHRSYGATFQNSSVWTLQQNAFPFYRGKPVGAIDPTTTPLGSWNYSMVTLLNYIVPAFAGYRGAIRWKVFANNTNPLGTSLIAAGRIAEAENTFYIDQRTPLIYPRTQQAIAVEGQQIISSTSSGGLSPVNTSIDGYAVTTSRNGAIEVELPFYDYDRFYPAKRQDKTQTFQVNQWWYSTVTHTATTGNINQIDYWCASGEDFNCFFFTGLPVVFYVQNPVP